MNQWSPPATDSNVSDRRLPGGSLFEAIHNRQLMAWSDRGGASKYIGDCWAVRCATALNASIGKEWPGEDGGRKLRLVIRLDENRRIERQANLHQLENPDFLLLGGLQTHRPIIQAADAKFAVDRIKPSQVSAEIVRQLIDVPENSATKHVLTEAIGPASADNIELVDGVFIAPASVMTELLLRRRARLGEGSVDPAKIITISVDPGELFAARPENQPVGALARVDQLPVTPRQNLLSAVYYFRIACACFHFWNEEHRPLLSANRDPEPAPVGVVTAEIASRARGASAAIDILHQWNRDLGAVKSARKQLANATRMPIRMRELRAQIQHYEPEASNRTVRLVRGELEKCYRRQLANAVGEIYPSDPRPIHNIVKEIESVNARLRPALLDAMDEIITSTINRSTTSAP